MSYTAVIDMSTFIWSKNDFENCTNQYYKLVSIAPTIYKNIKKLRIPILFRKELYDIVNAEFPHLEINCIDFRYGIRTLEFLIDSEWVYYTDTNEIGFDTNPNIIKDYFNDGITNEVYHQIVQIHKENPKLKFITYKPFFGSDFNLQISNSHNSNIDVDTLRYNSDQEVEAFFEKYRVKFEHHSKHKSELYYDKQRKEWVSPFSCFFNQGQAKVEELLEKSIPHQGSLYYFDDDNDVYVKFVKTHIDGLVFHGFDLSDSNNNVPNVVKKALNKNGRKF